MAKFPLMRSNILREDLDAVIRHLQGDDPILTNGPQCAAFEAEWSKWLGVKHSVFVNAGASANLLSMAVLKIRHPEGGEVIVPPLTWVSDIATVLQNGFTPVFADIDPRTLAMDTTQILAKVTDKHARRLPDPRPGLRRPERRAARRTEAARHPADRGRVRVARRDPRRQAPRQLRLDVELLLLLRAPHEHHRGRHGVHRRRHRLPAAAHAARPRHGARDRPTPTSARRWREAHPDLNPDFIFAHAAYNVRNTEIGGIMGRSQLKRLDANVVQRTKNLHRFLARHRRARATAPTSSSKAAATTPST